MARLKITDDSGFIAIVNPGKYVSFMDEDWGLPQLVNHFVNEMNKDAMIIWSTGMENEWHINVLDKPSDTKSFREFNKSIWVTTGQLFLTNYEDLTMAAQFDYCGIPSEHNSQLSIPLENGKYDLLIRQMYDPANQNYIQSHDTDFEIIIASENNSQLQKVETIFWWTGQGSR